MRKRSANPDARHFMTGLLIGAAMVLVGFLVF
jgi:hypothetical protein